MLPVDGVDVGLDRVRRHVESLSDLEERVVRWEEAQDSKLCRGQGCGSGKRRLGLTIELIPDVLKPMLEDHHIWGSTPQTRSVGKELSRAGNVGQSQRSARKQDPSLGAVPAE